jgi:hypothetical protein
LNDLAIAVLTNVGGCDPGERACRDTTVGLLRLLTRLLPQ